MHKSVTPLSNNLFNAENIYDIQLNTYIYTMHTSHVIRPCTRLHVCLSYLRVRVGVTLTSRFDHNRDGNDIRMDEPFVLCYHQYIRRDHRLPSIQHCPSGECTKREPTKQDALPRSAPRRSDGNIEPISMTYIPLNTDNSHRDEETTIRHPMM